MQRAEIRCLARQNFFLIKAACSAVDGAASECVCARCVRVDSFLNGMFSVHINCCFINLHQIGCVGRWVFLAFRKAHEKEKGKTSNGF